MLILYYHFYTFIVLKELSIASIKTPTSANVAYSMPAIPIAPKTRTATFIAIEKKIFCLTMLIVRFEIFTADATFKAESSIITISADSIAVLLPIAPMEIPTSGFKTGGGAVRSAPKKATVLFFCFLLHKNFNYAWFILREQPGVYLVNFEILCNGLSGLIVIPRKHNRFYTFSSERFYCRNRIVLYFLFNNNMAHILTVYRNMNYDSLQMA